MTNDQKKKAITQFIKQKSKKKKKQKQNKTTITPTTQQIKRIKNLKKKKKEKQERTGQIAHVQVHMGIFINQDVHNPHPIFSPF